MLLLAVASQTQWHTHYRNIPQFKRHWVEASDQSLASPERFSVASYNILGDRNASQHLDLYVNVPSCSSTGLIARGLFLMNSLDGTLILSACKRWTNILNSQTLWLKRDMQDLIRDALEIQLMVVQCFGKLISSGYWKERAFNIRTLAFVIMLPNFQFLRQMCESDSRRLLVGNIHLLYNPNRGEVKLGQIRFLSSRAQYLSREMGLVKCWTDEEVKIATGDSERHLAVHLLNLNSSYATINGGSTSTRGFNGEPLATSYHSKFLGSVDYLWYSDGILPTRVLDTVSISDLPRAGGLPCKKVGSDHLALVSEFSFSYQQWQQQQHHL